MVPGWFFMVLGLCLWFFMVSGWFFIVSGWLHGFSWFQVGFHGFSWFQVVFFMVSGRFSRFSMVGLVKIKGTPESMI